MKETSPSVRAAFLATFILFAPIQALKLFASPELPRSYVDTTYVPPSGRTIPVGSGGDFQAALDMAQPGDLITLEAGATFTGPFVLPEKAGNGWIVVRSSAPDNSLPALGSRVGPSYSPLLPKIVSADPGPALQTAPRAHHFRFIGVEFKVAANVTLNYGLISLGDSAQNFLTEVPHHLIFDRVYVHGNGNVDLRRGFSLQSAWTAVIDSYISEVHEVGADSQAIACWNGPGPFKIANNYLEGAGENVLFGGGDPAIVNLVPSDIEIRRNHFYKPLSWRIEDPSYAGKPWTVKNIFELKNARRVLVEGNVFENNWLHAQNGFAILFTVRNQDGAAPWSVVEDVTFTYNILRHTGSAVNVLGTDDLQPSQQTKRILIKDNLFQDVDGEKWGGSGRLFQMLDGSADVSIDHNTAFHTGEVVIAAGLAHIGFVYRNTLTHHNLYGVAGDGTFGNPLLTLTTYFPGAVFGRNVLVSGNASNYPPLNYFPPSWEDVGFVALAGGDYRLSAASPYRGGGTDGKDIGADIAGLNAKTAGVVAGDNFDTTPPTISGVTASSITSSSAVITWQTNEASDSLVEYGPTAAYGSSSSLDSRLVTSHTVNLTGLLPNKLYHYRAVSKDAASNLSGSGDFTFTTLAVGDTTPPVVSINVPVSGVVTVVASASDDVGVAGVEFQADGVRVGAEDTTAPYAVSWDSRTVADGNHTLDAVARDAAGNTTRSSMTVTVANGAKGAEPVVWTERVNVTLNGGVLRKTGGCDGCQDAGAISVQTIASGNGYLEVTASETNTQRAIGLSRGNTDTTCADIDFALQFWPNGGIDIRENGQYRNAETTYAAGDLFRIAIESGVVKYYKNGALLYTSAVRPTYPLQVDTVFFTSGGTLKSVVLSR